MEPTRELIDAMFWERVRRAREMSPEEKLLAGATLFDRSCRIMADGIRDEFPDADKKQIREVLVARLALARRLEQSP
jgi:hypothetical protein